MGLLSNFALPSDASSDLSPCSATGSASVQPLFPPGIYELYSSTDGQTERIFISPAIPKSAPAPVCLLPSDCETPSSEL